ncbi:MAG: hypothetical protein NVS9B7_19480 [Flavisolibacter sp.]
MDTEKKHPNYLKKTGRIVLKTLVFIILFILLVFFLIFTPPIQHLLTGKVQHYLENKLHTKVDIGGISIGLSGKISLENIYIQDKTKDTLVSGGAIKAHLNLFKLFSHEVDVKDLELQNITTKIKRLLPDTTFNFQFIVDAFSGKATTPDTSKAAPMKLDISDIALDNVNIIYNDIISGSDVSAHVGTLTASIDSLDPYTPKLYIPSLIVRNVQARIKQNRPLVTPKPIAVDLAAASTPNNTKFFIGNVDLNKISIQYANDVSAIYTLATIGRLKLNGKNFDFLNNKIALDQIALSNSKMVVRIGKTPVARATVREINQKVAVQKTQGWDFRIASIRMDHNTLQFDNDNKAKQANGMDFSHLSADSLSFYADNFIINPDTISLQVTRGTLKETSGFKLSALRGDILYTPKQTALKNFYIKTPGTEIRKNLLFDYASLESFTKNPSNTLVDIDLEESRIQVKDILSFAPQLRKNPALKNPNDTWYLNFIGKGSLNRLVIENLRFNGLKNTQLSASGTLVGLMNPKQAGGNFTIYRFHSTQSDIALFTGKKLSTPQLNLPEEFTLNGTIIGNAGKLATNLNLNTSEGFVSLKGSFSHLTDPNSITYDANLRTNNLQLGSILRQQGQIGSATGSFSFTGKGATPSTMSTKFNGSISSMEYNKYLYKNIKMNGFLRQKEFLITTVAKDPNLDFNLTTSGHLSADPSFQIDGVIDSIKTLPLHFTTESLVFKGKINGHASNLNADNPDANLLITKALFVSGKDRLPLDTIQLLTGKNDSANYIRFRSDILNAFIVGQYRMADLGKVIQNSIEPYFSVAATKLPSLKPYNFRFNADLIYTPIISSFIPALTAMKPIHSEGNFSNKLGMQASLLAPYILYNGSEINKMNLNISGVDSGLHVVGNIGHLKSGSSFDIYNTRINATALHNNVDFLLGIGDQNGRNKYIVSGLLSQRTPGSYALRLKPDSLLLNYQKWTVPVDNTVTYSPTNITANNFVLQQGLQKLSLNSLPGAAPQPLQVNFNSFRLGTITGFVKADSVLVDGVLNGEITLRNILKQPVFISDLTINDLSLRKDTIGNVNLKVNNETANRYTTNVTVTGHGNEMALKGYFEPAGKDINLNLDLAVRQLQLSSLNGAMASAITNASGTINGAVAIKGTTSKPEINGDLNFNKAKFNLTALGSQFNIDNQKIAVTQNGLNFNKFTVKDSASNSLVIDGNIVTSNFINYNFDLDIAAQNFQVLNSFKSKDKLYYGKLNITSDVHISGTEVKPVVDGSLVVNQGTKLFIIIPQSEPGLVDRQGVIQFVNMKDPGSDSLFKAYDTVNKANVTGMDITANISIKKEAELNIIVDEANGDFLNVRGEAQLSTGIDPSGKITMVGSYTLDQGSYQLSFNFLKRKFDIEKGSTIIWTGDPTSAQLNVTAIYVANTAPLDLVQNQVEGSAAAIRNTYLQKLPFEVHLTLTGELMKPVVGFNIVLPDNKNYGVSNDIVSDVQSRLVQIREDQGEINKQVFSLLLLGRFVGDNPFQSSGSGGGLTSIARQSVSKLLSDQLNQLASGLINGVDLNFDVVSTDDYTTGERRDRTDLNIGLSKRLLNERLKITVGSNFELQGPQNSNQQNNNIAGNISADYQVSRDGRYLLRFYRRNEYEGVVDGYIIETGLGFLISLDYNKFAEILHGRKQKIAGRAALTPSNSVNQNPRSE